MDWRSTHSIQHAASSLLADKNKGGISQSGEKQTNLLNSFASRHKFPFNKRRGLPINHQVPSGSLRKQLLEMKHTSFLNQLWISHLLAIQFYHFKSDFAFSSISNHMEKGSIFFVTLLQPWFSGSLAPHGLFNLVNGINCIQQSFLSNIHPTKSILFYISSSASTLQILNQHPSRLLLLNPK